MTCLEDRMVKSIPSRGTACLAEGGMAYILYKH